MKVLHFVTALGYTALPTMQCNIPQDQSPQLQCSGSFISRIFDSMSPFEIMVTEEFRQAVISTAWYNTANCSVGLQHWKG